MRDKKLLFNGWIRGLVHSNGLAYLPFLNQNELNDIQVAMNSGIRAMFGLRRFGNDPIGDLRKDLKIPTILEITKYVVQKAVWASRDKFLSYESRGPMTRNRSKMNLPLPDEKVCVEKWSQQSYLKHGTNSRVWLNRAILKKKLNIF